MNIKYVDYTGRQIEDFEVIKRIGVHITPSGQKKPLWECKCNKCGRIFKITSQDIKYRIDNNVQNCGMCGLDIITGKNKYKIHDDYIVGYTSKQEPFFIDKEDFDLIKDYTWYKNDQGYLLYKEKNHVNIRMHRLIMEHYYNIDGMDIDHIRANSRNDNRKGNLRIVDRTHNNMNRKSNSGIYYDQKNKKWVATIMIYKKYMFLGRFDNYEDALKVRKEAENKYFKEYSYDNSQVIALKEPVWKEK